MAAPQSPSSPENSQYHHFIPQFILRNFAHNYRPLTWKGFAKRHSNRGDIQRKTGLRPGEPALHIIDLSSDNPELSESPIRRTFGMMDMYRDFAKASDQNYLEKQLSKLESEAAKVISKIHKAFNSGNQAVWISRKERNILRKFLFIMKYRGKNFHKRFVNDEMEGYVEDDREKFLKYMRENGFQKPVDVWIHSIKTILELKMDPMGEWMKNLVNQLYPDDAMWFIMHTEWMYLALCTPSDTDREFILTENCYNVFEGPQTAVIDPISGERRCVAWTNFHEFSPISPKLVMVLRSFVLPNSEEDKNESINEWRENLFKLSTGMHADPSSVNSILADLPINKPRNSYSSVTSHGIELIEGEDGSRRNYHRFCFPFFKLNTEHVNKINAIFLENAYTCQSVAFTSQSALRIAIEYYLTLPADQGFKLVTRQVNDLHLSYLLKLEKVLRKLGSDKALVYQSHSAKTNDRTFEIVGSRLAEYLPEQPTEFMQLYMKLGGSAATIAKDLDQAQRMVNMRIKIDVWSQRLEESKREDIREKLRDIFCQLPARRLWYYLKRLRLMTLRDPGDIPDLNEGMQEYMEGPEDIIVKASNIIHTENLGRLMHFSVMQHIFLLKNPGLDLHANITMDEIGARRLGQITHFAFGPAGNVCDCGKIVSQMTGFFLTKPTGLDKLQEKAKLVTTMLKETRSHKKWDNPLWTDNQNIEMLTRVFVREDIGELLGDQLPSGTLQELKEVIFNIVYPTYSKRGVQR